MSKVNISQETINLMLNAGRDDIENLSLDDKCKKIIDSAKNSQPMKDAYSNSLTATGTEDKVESFTNYGFSNDTLNWWLWLVLYNDSWVFRKAIDKPAQDMVRCGITLSGESDKSKIYKMLKKFQSELIQINQWGALFGGSIGVMMFDNLEDEDYSKPISKKKLKNIKNMKIYVTDRWYGVSTLGNDTVSNMRSIDYGKPKYYNITFADNHQVKVHHDYILRYEHRVAPKLIKNGHLQGWGYAEGAHILNELSRDDKLKSAITSLVNKALIEVIKMAGMRGVFMGADKNNEDQLQKRLQMVNWARTFNSLTFLDKDDEYQEHSFSGLTGLADLLETNMCLVAAAVDMPGILFGELKGGLSQETEALERYDESIQNRCENYFRPVLEKLVSILYKIYDIDEEVEFTFNSLLVKKHDKEKIEGLKNFVDLLSTLLSDGVIDVPKYARTLMMYSKNSVIDFGFTEENINELETKSLEEYEDIDFDENEELIDTETLKDSKKIKILNLFRKNKRE